MLGQRSILVNLLHVGSRGLSPGKHAKVGNYVVTNPRAFQRFIGEYDYRFGIALGEDMGADASHTCTCMDLCAIFIIQYELNIVGGAR